MHLVAGAGFLGRAGTVSALTDPAMCGVAAAQAPDVDQSVLDSSSPPPAGRYSRRGLEALRTGDLSLLDGAIGLRGRARDLMIKVL